MRFEVNYTYYKLQFVERLKQNKSRIPYLNNLHQQIQADIFTCRYVEGTVVIAVKVLIFIYIYI